MVAGIVAVLTAHRLARLAILLPVVLTVTSFIFSGIASLLSTVELPTLFIQIALYFYVDKAFFAFLFFVQARIMWKSLDKWIEML